MSMLTRKNCFRYLKLMSPLNAAICTTTYLERQKCYGLGKKILFFFIWPWGHRSGSHEGHNGTWHTVLWSCTHIPNIIDLSRKTKMLWPGQENTILKKKLTLRSKVNVPRRSLQYVTPPYGHAPTYQINTS